MFKKLFGAKPHSSGIAHQLQVAYEHSPQRDMPFAEFEKEVRQLAQDNTGVLDFDEEFYLSCNADVREQVVKGQIFCGYVHFCLFGQREPRLWSTRYLRQHFGIAPHYPDGLLEPVNIRPLNAYGPDLSELPTPPAPMLVVMVSYLHEDLFFAGYAGFFTDLKPVFARFARIVVAVVQPGYNPALALKYDRRIEVVPTTDLATLGYKPDLIFCFDTETFFMSKQIYRNLDKTVYYCQDFEAGFFPSGSYFIRAETAVAESRNIVLSTGMLRNFLDQRKLLAVGARVHVTAPHIEPVAVTSQKTKKLFFYFRPERFNTRNMPEVVMEGVQAFCRKHTGYEIIMGGTVATNFSMRLNGTNVSVISKLPKEKYLQMLAECDVVVAFIYSAHPGVIAFQAAASGIPTITNTFENRDADYLKQISGNILPFNPVRENLLDALEAALQMPKGKPSFDESLYGGVSSQSFFDYVDGLRNAS
jgi:O-antigen biosynthesis protein